MGVKLNKNEYFPFALLDDYSKKKKSSKCRAIVGIIKDIKENKQVQVSIESNIISKGFKKIEFT